MNCKVWILLLLTVNAYGQTLDGTKTDWCLECHHQVIYLYKALERGDSVISYQAGIIRKLQQDTIRHENYVVNNTYPQQECEDCPTKKQKTRRWIERVLFFGAIGAVIVIRVKDE